MRTAPCQQCQRKGPVIHRCGAAPGTNFRCCCPLQMHKNPPASETCHDLLHRNDNGQCLFISNKTSAQSLERIFF